MTRLATALLVAASLAGCHWHIDDPGTDPSPVKLDFPAGVAVDPLGRYLYVSNGNADLRFGGGTLMMVDLARFECALDRVAGLAPDPACTIFPSASDVAVVRDDKGMPTAGCVADPLDPQVIDCIEDPFVLPNATVRVGNFAGTMRVRKVTGGRTLYLAVRGDPSVTYVDVALDRPRASPSDPDPNGLPGVLDCFDHPAELLARTGYDPATNVTKVPPRCDKSHLIQTYTCPGRFGCTEGDNDIPPEPFNMIVDEGARADGSPYARLLVGHLSAGAVTLVNLLGAPVVADVSPPFFVADQGGRRGAFGIARRDGAPAPLYYLTSNLSPAISTFSVTDSPAGGLVVPGPVFGISGAFSSGADGRELLFEPGGQRAFLTQNAPPSVAVLDTRDDQPDSRGLPANKIVDLIPICQGPSHMALRQAAEAGPAGVPARLRTRLYVTCFTSNQIMVVDPDRADVEDTVLVGRGPSELAFNFSGPETPLAERLPPPRRRRGFVTHYSESSIGVIDLEPGSPTENRLVARIGVPQPPLNP